MNITIREYNDDDFDSVNEILKDAFGIEKGKVTGEDFTEIVAEVDHEVCGYLLLTDVFNPIRNDSYYLVDYVCVSKLFRGYGIGEKMMNYAYEFAKEKNAMYLQLTCGRGRIAAHHLYEKCGYVMRDSDIFRRIIK